MRDRLHEMPRVPAYFAPEHLRCVALLVCHSEMEFVHPRDILPFFFVQFASTRWHLGNGFGAKLVYLVCYYSVCISIFCSLLRLRCHVLETRVRFYNWTICSSRLTKIKDKGSKGAIPSQRINSYFE